MSDTNPTGVFLPRDGNTSPPNQEPTNPFDKSGFKNLTEEQQAAVFQFTGLGTDDLSGLSLFEKAQTKLEKFDTKRDEFDFSDLKPFDADTDPTTLLAASKLFASTFGRDQLGVMQVVDAYLDTQEELRKRENQQQAIKWAEDAIKNFLENDNYEGLLENLRNLPATLPQEQVDRIKRQAVQQARNDEVSRQKRITAASGIGGFSGSGGAQAAIAEANAAHADSQISQAFNFIEAEQIKSQRSDMLQSAIAQAEMLTRRENQLLNLQSNFGNALRGDTADITQGIDNLSAFRASQNAIAQAEELRRAASSQATQNSIIQGVGAIGSAYTFGATGAAAALYTAQNQPKEFVPQGTGHFNF